MISIAIEREAARIRGFRVSGHAGYAEEGSDIVCAAVSSAVQYVCNAVTECAGVPAAVRADEDGAAVTLRLPPRLTQRAEEDAQLLLRSFQLHAGLLAEEYPAYIRVTETAQPQK